ncbi:MAG: Rieske (2Fe-2S) protein, partial [Stellaceae bacterium]
MSEHHAVATIDEIPPGTHKLFTIRGREIGIFNVKGDYYALLNRCPHAGASLCLGRVGGLVLSDGPGEYEILRQGEILRCPWHGWEYD